MKKTNDKDTKNSYPEYPSERKLFHMQNRAEIIERNIIIVLALCLVLLVVFVVANKTVFKSDEGNGLRADSLNSKYLDDKTAVANDDDDDTQTDTFDYSKSIICWGDSFSDNAANSTNFYTYYISKRIEANGNDINSVFSSGIEGDSVPVIAAKQGGIPMLAQPFTIPADKTPVEISLKSTLGGDLILQDKLNSGLNPCAIAGIQGTVEYVNGKVCFTRSKVGKTVNVEVPTTVVTNAMTNIKDYAAVYFFGNDITKYTPNELVGMYKEMVKFVGNDRYIIVGSITGDEKTLTPYEEALAAEFGTHFINFREYLTTTVYNEYDIKINTADAKALRTGSVPPSFVLNGKRLSDQGSEILANLIFEKMVMLNII